MSRDRAYLAPEPFTTRGDAAYSSDEIDDWCRQTRIDGYNYLRQQPAYPMIQESMDLINGDFMNQRDNVALSDVRTEQTYRDTKELVAAQTNLRIIPMFGTAIDQFKEQASVLNKANMAWQYMTRVDRAIRKVWQYACVGGTGFAGVRYEPDYYHRGVGDTVIDAYGPLDVMPVGLENNHDIQSAYTVTLRVRTPIHKAWEKFPLFRDEINSQRASLRDTGGVVAKAVQYVNQFISPYLRKFGQGRGINRMEDSMPWEMVNLYYSYTDDKSVNSTGHPIVMGTLGTSWCYVVPFVGQMLPTPDGKFQQAKYEDCYIYPNRRLVISTDDFCLNPEPTEQTNRYWHGKSPLVQFRADDWAWNWLGFPITRAGRSIEKANVEILRMIVDASKARLSPPSAYNRNGPMSQSAAESIDTRTPNLRVPLDMGLEGLENILRPLLDVRNYEYPSNILEFVASNEGRITQQMGVADATALARARQLPSGDSVEKILSAMGERIKDQSKNMESSICQLGEMWKSNFFQFISTKRRMQWGGPDWLSQQDFDYDPGSLIPQDVPHDKLPLTRLHTALESSGTDVSRFERARWHKDNFTFNVQPYSLHEMNSMTRKLFYLQLQRSGFPIDPWTLAEVFDIKNFSLGNPKTEDPETHEEKSADTILERWVAWQEIMAHISQAMGAGQAGAGGKGQKGRPPTGATAPTLEQKSGEAGTRSTVRESKH